MATGAEKHFDKGNFVIAPNLNKRSQRPSHFGIKAPLNHSRFGSLIRMGPAEPRKLSTIVDPAESKAFEESKQMTCRRCGSRGYIVKDFIEPRVIKCYYYDATDHLKDACDNRYTKKLCNKYRSMGHITSSCLVPKVPTCSYYTTRGNKKADYPLLKVIYKYCGGEGHIVNYYLSISGSERPYFSCGKLGHTAKDCQ